MRTLHDTACTLEPPRAHGDHFCDMCADALAQQQTREQEEGGGYGNQQQGDVDDGVRGAPIEGEGVKVRDPKITV